MIAQGYIPIQEKSYNICENITRVEIVSLNLHDFIHLNPKGIYMHSFFFFVIANNCVRKHGEKNCITKFQNTIYALIIEI